MGRAQKSATPTVGVLNTGSAEECPSFSPEASRYIDGQNVTIDAAHLIVLKLREQKYVQQ
jgi:hypothetical protein